jgi:hypothetical protein
MSTVIIVAPNRRAISTMAAPIKEPTIENSMLLLIPWIKTEIGPTSAKEKWSGCVGDSRVMLQQIAHSRIGAWKCTFQRDIVRPACMDFIYNIIAPIHGA